jgi:hypothetical protein
MSTTVGNTKCPESEIEFISTPEPAPQTLSTNKNCGVKIISVSINSRLKTAHKKEFNLIVQSSSIKNGVLPADGPGGEGFSNISLFALLISVPCLLSWLLKSSWLLTGLVIILTSFPLLASFWYLSSRLTSRKNEKVKLPGRPVEFYLNFLKKDDSMKYRGKNKIPIDTFQTLYFNGDVEFKGDCLEVLEYRHDWATFYFTLNILKFFLLQFVPEMILHTRSQGKIPHYVHVSTSNSLSQMKNKSAATTTAAMISTLPSSGPA